MFDANPFLHGFKKLALGSALAASALGVAGQAQAASISLPLSLAAIGSFETSCARADRLTPAAGVAQPTATVSKAQAILGGSMSALDRIRAQQAGLDQAPAVEIEAARVETTRPACAGLQLQLPAAPRALAPAAITPAVMDDNFLATSRIAIKQTSFTGRWNRVSAADLSHERVLSLVGPHDITDPATLQDVNRWVNRSITHVEDRVLWGARDYWASASETLELMRGDCEDVAILKYQMLLALGVDSSDMYLTLARDLARNADHAILIVRQGHRYFMLDNATDAILPANLSYDYRPTLSFNGDSAWLHGARTAPRQPQFAYLSVNATSNPRVIGFNR